METVTVKKVHNVGTCLQPAMTAQICAISRQYEKRGLAKAVAISAEEQVKAEMKTCALAPVAYRLSALSDSAVSGIYRRGKETMSSGDLLRYIGETRARRIQNKDFSEDVGIYESADPKYTAESEDETALVVADERPKSVARSVASLPHTVMERLPTWFQGGHSSTTVKSAKKFPFSALAAMVAVAISLMLIVASSVMLTRAESRISALTLEADALSNEISELRSDVEVNNNLLQIREIATNEYGMVEGEYVEMNYLDLQGSETIEVYEDEREGGIGLSALLSAMGIKK